MYKSALLWDRIYLFNPLVYIYLRGLGKVSLASFPFGELRPDVIPDADMSVFWSVVFPKHYSIGLDSSINAVLLPFLSNMHILEV